MVPNEFLEVQYRSIDRGRPREMMTMMSANNGKNDNDKLERGDAVEFAVSTCKRTGRKYAHVIVLVKSMEERALRTALLERGVVMTCKGDYGFLCSTTRV